MKVFISWSGERSRYLAEAVRLWLPRVIQSVRPWMSDQDVSAGSRWLSEVSSELSEAQVGLICVTPENQSNPWLLFEAGALSKTLDQTHVCPLLFNLSAGQLTGPLSQFQASQMDREGISRIVMTLNRALPANQLPANDLEEIFDVWWPKLSASLDTAPTYSTGSNPKRSTEEFLEEIVANTREQLRRENLRLEHLQGRDERLDNLLEMLQTAMSSVKHFESAASAFRGQIGRTASPEELQKVMPALTIPSVDGMKEFVSRMKDFSERERTHTERLLDARNDDGAPNEG